MQVEARHDWGKARPDPALVESARWHLLPLHSLDVAAVGIETMRRRPALRRLVALDFAEAMRNMFTASIGFMLSAKPPSR